MRLLFIFCAIFLIASCSGPDLADPITVDLNGNMKANLNGEEWTSGPDNSASLNFLNNKIHIEGYQKVDGIIRNHISITVKETNEGTFNSQTAKGIYYDVQNKKTFISESECNVDISSLNIDAKLINGIFSFTAIDLNSGDSIEVINGEFNNVNLSTVE